MGQKCKLIVVACNTATAAAIKSLRKKYNIAFVGIEPAVKPAALQSNSGNIGVLATKGTLNGGHFKTTSKKWAGNKNVYVRIGDGLVEKVENLQTNGEEVMDLLKHHLDTLIPYNIDQLVLGCTHYPFLIPAIRELVPDSVNVINPAPAVARQCKKVLEKNQLQRKGNTIGSMIFYTSGDIEKLRKFTDFHCKLDDKTEIKQVRL